MGHETSRNMSLGHRGKEEKHRHAFIFSLNISVYDVKKQPCALQFAGILKWKTLCLN